MTKTATILRFHPDGPAGLEEWETMNYADLVSGEPVQRGHLYHEIADHGYMAGVWDCTAFTDQMMPYPVDEYMFLLEGNLTMVLPNKTEIEVKEGEAFVIPKGLVCQWRQPVYVRKFFMILDGPVPDAENLSLQRITVPDLTGPSIETGLSTARRDFLNAAGTMHVGVQTFSAMSQPALKVTEHRLIQVLSGKLSLFDGEETHDFVTGETAYIHQSDIVGWTTVAGTRLVSVGYADRG